MPAVCAQIVKNEAFKQVESAFSKALGKGDLFSAFNNDKYFIFPGFCDVHVHFREPGFFYKETIKTGSLAAAHGGFTSVCAMPNLNPVPDCRENLMLERSIIDIDAAIHVFPYGAVTKGELGEELSDMEAMAGKVIAFSDDGKGIQDPGLMREAMQRAKALNKIIAAHCEDNSLLEGGYIHKGSYAAAHGHKGICSESEWRPIERDLKLADETGCAYHVCHISCKESLDLIRDAKKSGVNVTCETAPHYLILDENDLQEDGRFKMNPPLRSPEDKAALTEGILDGSIDMIATDHAPHSAEEKSKGLAGSAFGIVGLETAFPLMYTKFVRLGMMSIEKLLELMCLNPVKRFRIPAERSFTVWDLDSEITVNPDEFLSKGRATPFAGMKLFGRCKATVCNGKTAYIDD